MLEYQVIEKSEVCILIVGHKMKLRFPVSEILPLAACYQAGLRERDRRLTAQIQDEVFPSYRNKGYLTKAEFLTVCAWKTPRSASKCTKSDEEIIRDISTLVLTTQSEVLRIQSWTMLSGVKWPTASVFLHFTFIDKYPILDFRALWSLGLDIPPAYTFKFWMEYVLVCRGIAEEIGVSMRTLDQALWMYSKENQK
jgi:thermostable 8-oxoguanine DNA glycosylase